MKKKHAKVDPKGKEGKKEELLKSSFPLYSINNAGKGKKKKPRAGKPQKGKCSLTN